jgi:phenylacetate-CoA ligase
MVAYECAEKNGMHHADDMILAIVAPDIGKQFGPHDEGEVVATLLNETYPLNPLRYWRSILLHR